MAFSVVIGVGGALGLIWLYFLPTINAYKRRHHNRGSIALINVFLGWTFLGWIIAMSMSASGIRRDVV